MNDTGQRESGALPDDPDFFPFDARFHSAAPAQVQTGTNQRPKRLVNSGRADGAAENGGTDTGDPHFLPGDARLESKIAGNAQRQDDQRPEGGGQQPQREQPSGGVPRADG